MLEAGALDVEVLEVGNTPDDEELMDDVGVVPGGARVALGDIELDEDAGLVLGDDGVALDVVREVEEVVLEADCVKEGLNNDGFALDVVRAVEDARLEADGVELGLGDDEAALDAVEEAEEVEPEVDCAKAGLAMERARRKIIPALMLAMVKVKDSKRYKHSRILYKM